MSHSDNDESNSFQVELDDGLIREVRSALSAGDRDLLLALTATLHPADLADLIEQLGNLRLELIETLGEDIDYDAFTYLSESVREELLTLLDNSAISAALAELETDDAIDILEDLDEDQQAAILAGLPQTDRAVIEQGLAYPEYSAGRLTQRAVVAVPDYWIVGQTIDYLRAAKELPDDFYDVYIVDARFQPVGSVPLSNILRSKRRVAMHDLKMKSLHLIEAETDQEDVAYTFRQYGLVSAPVVDKDGRLMGSITVDDIVEVIDEEAEDDLLKLGGVQESEFLRSPWRTSIRRLPWLFVNLLTAIAASLVIANFDEAISKVVALAVLMPIVASMGGNAGTQTLTVTVRALANRDLTTGTKLKMFVKEIVVGLVNSAAFLVAGIAIALIWFGDPTLAAIFGAAMVINLLAAAFAGLLIPLTIDKIGWDPAISSGVFLTTVTDVVGFFAFLGLAVAYL